MTPWEKYKKKLASSPKWSIDDNSQTDADEKTIIERYNTCLQCDMLMSATKQCRQCNCFMPVNVKFTRFQCPLDKW